MKVRPLLTLLGGLLILGLAMDIAFAQSSSTNYQIEESYIGPGGQLDSSSASYKARASLGDTGVGYGSSTNFGLWAGYTTTDVPYIEMVVTGATIDLGTLTTSTTGTGNGTFYVRTYLSSGYIVTTSSPGLVNSSYTLANIGTAAASAAGTEQFGINLVANTNPATFGANPLQLPDVTFSFGAAAAGYNTTNVYQYNDGDTVAQSTSSSGRTEYKISYIANIAALSPGGVYTMTHSLVATSTY